MASDLETRMQLSFARESVSAARNRLYAAKVKKDGQTQSARLLSALARGEEISARRSLIYLRGKISTIEDHLAALQKTKQALADEVYSRDRQVAREAGNKSADAALDQFAQVNANHAARLDELTAGGPDRTYYVCQVCGYIAADRIPDKCPVCGAVPERFKEEDF
jgi:rubrerythrin